MSFRRNPETCKSSRHRIKVSQALKKERQIKALRNVIKECFRSFAACRLAKLKGETSDKRKPKAQILLAFYFVDIRGTEDLLYMKRGSQTAPSCH